MERILEIIAEGIAYPLSILGVIGLVLVHLKMMYTAQIDKSSRCPPDMTWDEKHKHRDGALITAIGINLFYIFIYKLNDGNLFCSENKFLFVVSVSGVATYLLLLC